MLQLLQPRNRILLLRLFSTPGRLGQNSLRILPYLSILPVLLLIYASCYIPSLNNTFCRGGETVYEIVTLHFRRTRTCLFSIVVTRDVSRYRSVGDVLFYTCPIDCTCRTQSVSYLTHDMFLFSPYIPRNVPHTFLGMRLYRHPTTLPLCGIVHPRMRACEYVMIETSNAIYRREVQDEYSWNNPQVLQGSTGCSKPTRQNVCLCHHVTLNFAFPDLDRTSLNRISISAETSRT